MTNVVEMLPQNKRIDQLRPLFNFFFIVSSVQSRWKIASSSRIETSSQRTLFVNHSWVNWWPRHRLNLEGISFTKRTRTKSHTNPRQGLYVYKQVWNLRNKLNRSFHADGQQSALTTQGAWMNPVRVQVSSNKRMTFFISHNFGFSHDSTICDLWWRFHCHRFGRKIGWTDHRLLGWKCLFNLFYEKKYTLLLFVSLLPIRSYLKLMKYIFCESNWLWQINYFKFGILYQYLDFNEKRKYLNVPSTHEFVSNRTKRSCSAKSRLCKTWHFECCHSLIIINIFLSYFNSL